MLSLLEYLSNRFIVSAALVSGFLYDYYDYPGLEVLFYSCNQSGVDSGLFFMFASDLYFLNSSGISFYFSGCSIVFSSSSSSSYIASSMVVALGYMAGGRVRPSLRTIDVE